MAHARLRTTLRTPTVPITQAKPIPPVAARIINLFPWQPRRDPHHWLCRFSHPRAITLYGRTANYRCRDTLFPFQQHSIDVDYRVISPYPFLHANLLRFDPRRVAYVRTCVWARARMKTSARASTVRRQGLGYWDWYSQELFLPYARYVLPSHLASKSETGIGEWMINPLYFALAWLHSFFSIPENAAEI